MGAAPTGAEQARQKMLARIEEDLQQMAKEKQREQKKESRMMVQDDSKYFSILQTQESTYSFLLCSFCLFSPCLLLAVCSRPFHILASLFLRSCSPFSFIPGMLQDLLAHLPSLSDLDPEMATPPGSAIWSHSEGYGFHQI